MRVDINLATQPYENARAFFVRWTALLALLAVLTVLLAAMAAQGYLGSRDVSRQIQTRQQEIARMEAEAARGQAVLEQPQNRTLRLQAAFLNGLIVRKSFSWTQVFSDLEKLMPGGLQVVAMRPELDESNELQLNVTVAGSSREQALELLHRMERTERFRWPQLRAESTEAQSGRLQFQIMAFYVPGAARPAPETPGAAGGGR